MRMAKTRAAANKQQDEDDEQDTVVAAPKPKQQAASTEADPSDIAAAKSDKMPAGTRSDNEEKAAPKSAYDPSKVRGDDDDDPPSRSAKVAGDPGVITVPDKVFALAPMVAWLHFQRMGNRYHMPATSGVTLCGLSYRLILGAINFHPRPPASRHVASHADAPAALLQRQPHPWHLDA